MEQKFNPKLFLREFGKIGNKKNIKNEEIFRKVQEERAHKARELIGKSVTMIAAGEKEPVTIKISEVRPSYQPDVLFLTFNGLHHSIYTVLKIVEIKKLKEGEK